MKKSFLTLMMTALLCAFSVSTNAYELDKSVWTVYGGNSSVETYYNLSSIRVDGNIAKVWLCYYYNSTDSYRLFCKEFYRGSDKAKVLKILDYYGDGTFRRGSVLENCNVVVTTDEQRVLSRIW